MNWHEVEASGIDKCEKSVVNERRSHSKDSRRISLYGQVLQRRPFEISSSSVFSLLLGFSLHFPLATKRYLTINAVPLLS